MQIDKGNGSKKVQNYADVIYGWSLTEVIILIQVVLEDGRVIEEDDPEITVDTVEDTENFSDDADDDIKNIGGSLVPVSIENSSRYTIH